MSKQIGQLLTCDRCGTTEFLHYVGTEDFDGGFTKVNDFSKPSEPWGFEDLGDCAAGHDYVDLCPKCRKAFILTKKEFIIKGVMQNDQT